MRKNQGQAALSTTSAKGAVLREITPKPVRGKWSLRITNEKISRSFLKGIETIDVQRQMAAAISLLHVKSNLNRPSCKHNPGYSIKNNDAA